MLTDLWAGLLFAGLCGGLTGYWRWEHGYFAGVQGMFLGLLIGTVAAWAAAPGANAWRFRGRLTASLILVLTFVIVEMLGIGLAMPYFAPGDWFGQTLRGEHIDLVIGPSRASGFPFRLRQVGPTGWIAFSILDLTFQSFFTILGLGIRLNSRRT